MKKTTELNMHNRFCHCDWKEGNSLMHVFAVVCKLNASSINNEFSIIKITDRNH